VDKLISNNKKPFRKLENFDHDIKTSIQKNCFIKFKGKSLFNFASNDYLGLSVDKDLINESIKWTKKYGSSLSSSRLITGNLDKIFVIEKLLSKFTKHEKTIILGNGFLLNSTLIPALTGNTLGRRNKFYIFSDKLNHASLNYGCLASRQRCFRYNHLDLNHLESLLRKKPINSPKIIISETLFSMDGDFLNIDGIRMLSKKYNAILYLDEAHAIGVYGKKGFGLAAGNKKLENEIVVGTFSKALGSYGSFVSCSKHFYNKIVNNCSGLIYSTALPPSVLGSIAAGVKKIPKISNLRIKIKENYEFVLKNLNKLSFNTGNSNSHIIPIIFGSHSKCQKIYNFLLDKGYYVKGIRSPTVPVGSERLRLSLTAKMNQNTLKNFIKIISEFK
jgi:8-amino-7-oxononanoate synthase